MENLKPYIGSYMDTSIFLNSGKYGWYLNHDKKLYNVPKCFQKPDFGLQDAIKIIEYKKKMKERPSALVLQEQQIENKKDFQDVERPSALELASRVEPKGTSEDLDEIITKVKSKKKVLN